MLKSSACSLRITASKRKLLAQDNILPSSFALLIVYLILLIYLYKLVLHLALA
jgi:hypothetical protein